MPSSTSNSDLRRPKISHGLLWIAAVSVVILLLASAEILNRLHGISPSVVDTAQLWRYLRDRVGSGSISGTQIVVIGDSRANLDIDPRVLSAETGFEVVMLGIDGASSWPVLRDLAEKTSFRGIILYSFRADSLDGDSDLAHQYVRDYYAQYANLGKYERILNTRIALFLQSRLSVFSTRPEKLYLSFTSPAEARALNFLVVGPDRTMKAYYYEKLTRGQLSQIRAARIRRVKETNHSVHNPVFHWEQQMLRISRWVRLVEDRGGHVVLVRFPTSDEHWIEDEQLHPRSEYWDRIDQLTGAVTIHFQDIDGIEDIDCPDTSHLGADDSVRFTTALSTELVRRGITDSPRRALTK